ncbi:PRA1 family protein [Dictyocaulus viviparus]|uniref:PRA1 family protein n=1 Tax=Dictyocaulus viviparus TaxID=29172 RepID=A0A0D8XYH4_DICVI|nr:PRA1 family protein [Dictyocaulus viviparus]
MSEYAAAPPEIPFRLGNGVELPPFRTVDDFILGKARFELPPYNDLQRWNNRIISNLLYYQTNYFVFFVVLFILQSFLNSQNLVFQDLALGLSAILVVAGVVIFAISDNPSFYQTRRDHPLITLGAIILACYFFIQVLPSVLTVLFSVLLPWFLILCHASVRLRDFMSKVTQTAEKLGLRTTVMGRLLNICGITVKT